MADFDDLRNLTDDDDFSFDNFDDGDEVDFDRLGRAIGEEDDDDDWDDTESEGGGLNLDALTDSPLFAQASEQAGVLVGSINSLERMLLSVMLFANVFVVGLAMLMITGRLG